MNMQYTGSLALRTAGVLVSVLGMVLALAAGASAAELGTTHNGIAGAAFMVRANAPACHGAGCDGLSPEATGCGRDAVTLRAGHARIFRAGGTGLSMGTVVGAVELRSSAACGTYWARFRINGVAPCKGVDVRLIAYPSGAQPRREQVLRLTGHQVGHGTGGWRYTAMLHSPGSVVNAHADGVDDVVEGVTEVVGI
ncbi:DUF2690 domain-containing protein [Candidatus Saccharibacteria bacterium]|nr:DUF2690 domain-containing protein [Candidatus Saccharibacteria bacterium]